jgi:hypothetical protein
VLIFNQLSELKRYSKKKTDVAQTAQRDFINHAVQCAALESSGIKDNKRHSRLIDIAVQCDAEDSTSKQTADAATAMTGAEGDIETSNKAPTEVLQLIYFQTLAKLFIEDP